MNHVLPKRLNHSLVKLRRDSTTLVMTIPRPLLRRLQWRRGDVLLASVEDDCLRVVRIKLEEVYRKAVE